MAVSYQYARQFIGQPVEAHCIDGRRYYGIVRGVNPGGIWLDMPDRGALVGGSLEQANIHTADQPEEINGETVQFGFRRFFFPFFFLLFLFRRRRRFI
jgi:hypothetical protein